MTIFLLFCFKTFTVFNYQKTRLIFIFGTFWRSLSNRRVTWKKGTGSGCRSTLLDLIYSSNTFISWCLSTNSKTEKHLEWQQQPGVCQPHSCLHQEWTFIQSAERTQNMCSAWWPSKKRTMRVQAPQRRPAHDLWQRLWFSFYNKAARSSSVSINTSWAQLWLYSQEELLGNIRFCNFYTRRNTCSCYSSFLFLLCDVLFFTVHS